MPCCVLLKGEILQQNCGSYKGFMQESIIHTEDTELAILEGIYASKLEKVYPKQRDLAYIAGASLGMTNAVLKRLAQKGWIVIQKLNSRNIRYAVTPEGANEIAKRSYRYFKRTIKNIVFYKERLEEIISNAKKKGIHTVCLFGESDLDFILEHSCSRHDITFKKFTEDLLPKSIDTTSLFIISENCAKTGKHVQAIYLQDVFTGKGVN